MSTNPINVRLPQFDLTTEDGRQAAHRSVNIHLGGQLNVY